MKLFLTLLAPVAAVALALGCESSSSARADQDHKHDEHGASGGMKTAVANITPSKAATTRPSDGQPKGKITFKQTGQKVHITGKVTGLRPNARHAIHIHEKADLSAPDLSSAGGHYNPEKHPHGAPATQGLVHAGDLGNLKTDADGTAKMDLTVENISLGGEKNDVIGKPVIIHAKEDDLKSQPSGAAGDRIGGGIIEMRN